MPAMTDTVEAVKAELPDVRVMVGGAVVTQSYADRINADGYARDAVSAGDLARRLLEME